MARITFCRVRGLVLSGLSLPRQRNANERVRCLNDTLFDARACACTGVVTSKVFLSFIPTFPVVGISVVLSWRLSLVCRKRADFCRIQTGAFCSTTRSFVQRRQQYTLSFGRNERTAERCFSLVDPKDKHFRDPGCRHLMSSCSRLKNSS